MAACSSTPAAPPRGPVLLLVLLLCDPLAALRVAPGLRRAALPSSVRRTGPAAMLGAPDLHTVTALADAGERLTEEAIKAANGELGWWGSYIKLVEDGLFSLHDTLTEKGVPFPYGLSILTFVLGVKPCFVYCRMPSGTLDSIPCHAETLAGLTRYWRAPTRMAPPTMPKAWQPPSIDGSIPSRHVLVLTCVPLLVLTRVGRTAL